MRRVVGQQVAPDVLEHFLRLSRYNVEVAVGRFFDAGSPTVLGPIKPTTAAMIPPPAVSSAAKPPVSIAVSNNSLHPLVSSSLSTSSATTVTCSSSSADTSVAVDAPMATSPSPPIRLPEGVSVTECIGCHHILCHPTRVVTILCSACNTLQQVRPLELSEVISRLPSVSPPAAIPSVPPSVAAVPPFVPTPVPSPPPASKRKPEEEVMSTCKSTELLVKPQSSESKSWYRKLLVRANVPGLSTDKGPELVKVC